MKRNMTISRTDPFICGSPTGAEASAKTDRPLTLNQLSLYPDAIEIWPGTDAVGVREARRAGLADDVALNR